MILKPKGTVVLPRAAHDGLKILPWAKEVNRSLQQLRDRVLSAPKGKGGGGGSVTHPFKITTVLDGTDLKLYVNYGQILQSWLKTWNAYSTTADAESQLRDVLINGGALLNDPINTTPGFITLSASTTYGIWLTGSYASTGTESDFFSSTSSGRGYTIVDGTTLYFDEVIADSTYLDPTDKPANGDVWLYLGKVVVDGDKVAAITQFWKSDIVLPSFLMAQITPSTDDDNSLVIGTDGLPWVPPIVSADVDNSITTGTDGGAYYDAP